MTHIEEMKQWLEALEHGLQYVVIYSANKYRMEYEQAITSLRQAIEDESSATQEPDVIMHPHHGTWDIINNPPKGVDDVALYYAQPKAEQIINSYPEKDNSKREWVGLTDEDWKPFYENHEWMNGVRWAETKLKEKNT